VEEWNIESMEDRNDGAMEERKERNKGILEQRKMIA
jgi:hypothetical protein